MNPHLTEHITNGYYIITALKKAEEMETRTSDYIAAGTLNWVSQVSFTPVQLAVSVALFSDLNETIDKSGGFALHVLGEEQAHLIEKFSQNSHIQGNEINGIPFSRDTGQVILDIPTTVFQCKLQNSLRVGDHTLHIGEVYHEIVYKNTLLSTLTHPSEYTPERASPKK